MKLSSNWVLSGAQLVKGSSARAGSALAEEDSFLVEHA